MSNAESIGLAPFMDWLVSGPWTATLFAWLFTPVGVYLVAFVFESRLIGRDFRPWKYAFRGFMPGDMFLGASFGQFVWQIGKHGGRTGWWSSGWWHFLCSIGAVVVGLLVREKMDRPLYNNVNVRRMNSPSKLYHDFVIYMAYRYVFFVTAVSATFMTGFRSTLLLPYFFLACWLIGLVMDARLPKIEWRRLAKASYPSVWKPIWIRRTRRW